MNTKELARLTVIKSAIDGVYTVKQAAGKLGMSMRWVKHLKKAVREPEDGAVIHGNAGRHPAHVTDEAIRKKVIALKKVKYTATRISPTSGNCLRNASSYPSAIPTGRVC